MKLTGYLISGHSIEIRPAPARREWMNQTIASFAYRCLPLNIANAHGWEILCPGSFTAVWNGSHEASGVTVALEDDLKHQACSHFGYGILTFRTNCVFRTEPGYDLLVQGPVNRPKDGISALTGIIETDWAPFTFTMNWKFTRADHSVSFSKGEPICHFFPIPRGGLESFQPMLEPIAEDPELAQAVAGWKEERKLFNADLKKPGSGPRAQKWQKQYYRGVWPDGERRGGDDHRVHLRLKPFVISPKLGKPD